MFVPHIESYTFYPALSKVSPETETPATAEPTMETSRGNTPPLAAPGVVFDLLPTAEAGLLVPIGSSVVAQSPTGSTPSTALSFSSTDPLLPARVPVSLTPEVEPTGLTLARKVYRCLYSPSTPPTLSDPHPSYSGTHERTPLSPRTPRSHTSLEIPPHAGVYPNAGLPYGSTYVLLMVFCVFLLAYSYTNQSWDAVLVVLKAIGCFLSGSNASFLGVCR